MKTQRKEVKFRIPGYLQVETGYRKVWSLSQWDGLKFHHIQFIESEEKRGISRKVSIPLLPGFQGALEEGYVDRSYSAYNDGCRVVTPIGFSEEELKSPVSIVAWREYRGMDESYCYRIETFEDYLVALAENSLLTLPEGGKIHPFSGNRLVELPREDRQSWAKHYVVVSPKGEIVTDNAGEGDFCPEVIKGKNDWRFECDFDRHIQPDYRQVDMDDAISTGLTEQWREVLDFIREGYRTHRNPLEFMRRDHPGLWDFVPKKRYPLVKEGDIVFLQYPKSPEQGWQVLYRPVQVARPEDLKIVIPDFDHLRKALVAVEEKLAAG